MISLVDTAFVGSLGTADLAAVGIASSFFLLVVWTLAQTRSAVLAVVARFYGRQRLDDVKDLVPIAIWMNFLMGFVFFVITNYFAEGIFRMYNAEGEVLSKAVEYYHVRSFGHPMVLATFAMTGAFRGIQNLSLEHVDQHCRRAGERCLEPGADLRPGTDLCNGHGGQCVGQSIRTGCHVSYGDLNDA